MNGLAKRMVLAALSAALGETPKNSYAWTYTIWGFDGSPYITRTLFPRIAGHRLMLHRIHRADSDRWLHNHPWATATFRILSGGYTEERLTDAGVVTRAYVAGDVNRLDATTFHRITSIQPNTWTIGLIGARVQGWGFLVNGELVQWQQYFAQQNQATEAGKGLS